MEIISILNAKVFTDRFVDKIKNSATLISESLGCDVSKGESVFLNTFVDEVRNSLPSSGVFTQIEFGSIFQLPKGARVDSFLRTTFEDLRKDMCSDPCWTGRKDQAERCFKGAYSGRTDIDAIIVDEERKRMCLLEYESDFRGHCENLFKMYRLRESSPCELEYLFVTEANIQRNRESDGAKTTELQQLKKHIELSKKVLQ